MKTRVQIYEFYKVKFGDLWVEVSKSTKFQHNISKIMQARPKTQGHGGEYHYGTDSSPIKFI